MRGRKPELKAIDGGLTHVPAMPSHLDKAMLETWQATCADLQGRGLLYPTALPLVAAYVGAIWMAGLCRQDIARDGLTVRTAAHTLKPHPAASILADQLNFIARMGGELGITAVARNRPGIKAQTKAANDIGGPLAEFDV